METNESILVRDVVGLDDRRVIGKMRELRVNCDSLAVSHYIVASATTTSPLVLPFDRALAVGDTFVTVQSRENFLPSSSADAQALIANGFKLTGVDAFSRTGDKLGVVASYEFDPVFGTVTSIALDDGAVFPASDFVFFAPEFVFVDNGAKTAAELREGGVAAQESPTAGESEETVAEAEAEAAGDQLTQEAADALAADEIEAEMEAEEEIAEEEIAEEADEPEETVAEAEAEAAGDQLVEAAAEDASELSEEDAQLVELLVGSTVNNDVTSEDGAFTVAKGVVLTREIVDEAIAHDALLLLTLAADL